MQIAGNTTALGGLALPDSARQRNTSDLGQEDFLKLMVTQFRNQDPLKPMENGEFLGQLAQFSTVSGIGEMNSAVMSLAESIQASQALQAAGMVGKTVLVDNGTARLDAGGVVAGAVDVPQRAQSVNLRIVDAAGQVVRELSLGPRDTGLADFEWDGLTSSGGQALPGEYRISAQVDIGGATLAVPTLMSSRVASISLSPTGTPSITTDRGEQMPISSVRNIR